MTPTLEAMAREAGLIHDAGFWFSDDDQQDVSTAALTRFAALVRAQALEDAAKVCDAIGTVLVRQDGAEVRNLDVYEQGIGAEVCAKILRGQDERGIVAAIRALQK